MLPVLFFSPPPRPRPSSPLPSYVGVVGLARRLALDRVLPDVFMTTNSFRGTAHWVIIGFFALTASLYLVLAAGSSDGDQQMNDLSGVYALVSGREGGDGGPRGGRRPQRRLRASETRKRGRQRRRRLCILSLSPPP